MLSSIAGYKTHILVVAYIAFLAFTNQPLEGDAIVGNIDAGVIQDSLIAGIVSTLKAAWDRYAAREES